MTVPRTYGREANSMVCRARKVTSSDAIAYFIVRAALTARNLAIRQTQNPGGPTME